MDVLNGEEARMHLVEEQGAMQHHASYIQQDDHQHHHNHHHSFSHLSNGDLSVIEHEDDNANNGVGGTEGLEGDAVADPGNFSDKHGSVFVGRGAEDTENQLTLSFQGQVYVFDAVSPEKVQSVLLLLGGREMPPYVPVITQAPNDNNKQLSSTPQRFNIPQRLASLIRFREKRKERNFEKKIRYSVRKEVALRMQRNKGQFTSSKPNPDDSTSATSSWDPNQGWNADGNGSHHQEIVCRHCGVSEKSTPMMRRGPEGPRTLCNACGLMWANKGTLRDLSKAASQQGQNISMMQNEENGNCNPEALKPAGNSNEPS